MKKIAIATGIIGSISSIFTVTGILIGLSGIISLSYVFFSKNKNSQLALASLSIFISIISMIIGNWISGALIALGGALLLKDCPSLEKEQGNLKSNPATYLALILAVFSIIPITTSRGIDEEGKNHEDLTKSTSDQTKNKDEHSFLKTLPDKAEISQDIPFTGEFHFNFTGGAGTNESITINKDGSTKIVMHGSTGTGTIYEGPYSNPIKISDSHHYLISESSIATYENGQLGFDCIEPSKPCVASLERIEAPQDTKNPPKENDQPPQKKIKDYFVELTISNKIILNKLEEGIKSFESAFESQYPEIDFPEYKKRTYYSDEIKANLYIVDGKAYIISNHITSNLAYHRPNEYRSQSGIISDRDPDFREKFAKSFGYICNITKMGNVAENKDILEEMRDHYDFYISNSNLTDSTSAQEGIPGEDYVVADCGDGVGFLAVFSTSTYGKYISTGGKPIVYSCGENIENKKSPAKEIDNCYSHSDFKFPQWMP